MAKREVLGGETGARSEEKPNKAYKQLDHPVRLGGILAPTTNRKSLYNRQYGVFTRDRSRSFPARRRSSRQSTHRRHPTTSRRFSAMPPTTLIQNTMACSGPDA